MTTTKASKHLITRLLHDYFLLGVRGTKNCNYSCLQHFETHMLDNLYLETDMCVKMYAHISEQYI